MRRATKKKQKDNVVVPKTRKPKSPRPPQRNDDSEAVERAVYDGMQDLRVSKQPSNPIKRRRGV